MNIAEWWRRHVCIYFRVNGSDDQFECECGKIITYDESEDTFVMSP